MTWLLAELGSALALTIVLELAVVTALGGCSAIELTAVALVNVVTNPLLNLALLVLRWGVLPRLSPGLATPVEWAFIAVGEVVVVLVEWRLLVWSLRGDSRTWLIGR